ncbi:tRNA lysidine(34) synthetase TilS [Massilia agilis]|uniref:tRNA(Ile)-lysidine synthase n=1 Tax=Massilia agilis TaxID=1811226 RepID=A0ABT2D9R1_9BURK|nr:tRNA lysidine(34) synthetase TilS [Massilia agilis]
MPARLARVLDALRAEFPSPAIAVAFSGGLDSMVLLHLAHAWAREHGISLFAFHVHHGLSPNADQWLAHCERACAQLGVRFDHRRVAVDKGRSGVEQAARKERYAALGQMCVQHGVGLLLTAHHLDDQAETVLLQLLRGSGPAGLSGMDTANRAPTLLGTADVVMARPLLGLTRAELESWAREEALGWVEDESNIDPRYARNALRHQVMPALAQAFPGFQERVARSAAHAQSAQRLLNELAAQDLAACLAGDALSLPCLRKLNEDRIHNLLRYWLAQRGIRMPSTSWLEQMAAQALDAREDAQLRVTHPECEIRRHRDRLYITPRLATLAGMRDPDDVGVIQREGQAFRWNGEASLAFPDYGGVLHFDPAPQGFDPDWLRARTLQIDFRKGGERLKPATNRPTRSLKAHYQALGVPAWERERLPLVFAGYDLLFAAGIGMDCRHLVSEATQPIALRWEMKPFL